MKEIWLKAEISTLKSEKENLMRTLEESAEEISEQDNKWQKLKEWLEEQQNNFKLISKTLGKADYVLLSNCIKSVLSQMAKLEGEDE